jgi:hypothetical protein
MPIQKLRRKKFHQIGVRLAENSPGGFTKSNWTRQRQYIHIGATSFGRQAFDRKTFGQLFLNSDWMTSLFNLFVDQMSADQISAGQISVD